MSSSPQFSLLIPSYNRPEYIRETVNSLLANAAPDVEIIVSDDASPRRSEIKEALSDLIQSGKVQYIQQEKNLSWSNNRNALVNAARGEYVVLLGDDDRLKPGAIDSLRKWIAKYPEVSIFGLGYDAIDERGDRVFTYCTPRVTAYQIGRGDAWREIFYFDAVPMWSHHPFTMCCRRSLARRFPYDRDADIGDDTLFLFQVLAAGEVFVALPENCFEWRNSFDRNGKYANLSSQNERCIVARRKVWAKLIQSNKLPDDVARLLRNPLFLYRFLTISSQEATDVASHADSAGFDPVKLIESLPTGQAPVTRLEKIRRHIRASKVMGLCHLTRLNAYFTDRRRLRSRLMRQTKD
jgi:glycosyltransferase involved in cell wall biosynthesis